MIWWIKKVLELAQNYRQSIDLIALNLKQLVSLKYDIRCSRYHVLFVLGNN